MEIELTSVHFIYLGFIAAILAFMLLRLDTTFISLAGVFFISLAATHSAIASVMGLFNSLIYAAGELLPTIFIICFTVSMSELLAKTGVNEAMVTPIAKWMKGPALAYWITGALMFIISSFFWPSPAVALIGAVLLPAALKAGLSPIAVACAMNLFGHGFALSGDYIIQAAPKLTGDAAGLSVAEVMSASVPLVLIMGFSTTAAAFFMLRKEKDNQAAANSERLQSEPEWLLPPAPRKWLALMIPVIFLGDIAAMLILELQGDEATALVGGTAVFVMILIHFIVHKHRRLEKITGYFIRGFQFGFKVFAPVIPIAAFFYLGDAGFEKVLTAEIPGFSNRIVQDLGSAFAHSVPLSPELAAVALTVTGAVTGLDGSGFSGISLAGSAASMFAAAVDGNPAVLTALGQISAIWVGGGTLVPWALIPVAAICKVDPFDLARKNFIPVAAGLTVTTIAAIFLL
ncbi:hypothetical protein OIO07_18345 [Bacillus paralicheniformis]|jgi:TRAP-type C4-dicarboxylate transport system permease large subunit|uniref:transporter YhfA n=2 Tax=Bacillus paralicheniformis TaxID=1648923 RepID=UPI0003422E38|nr:transporter YhfA [Bacillus paralicheniformis]KJD53531.1 membrane protein [Bacillus amyloliquefaciens]KUL14553.1 membrane protein [Bacillus licheniformis LMG 7559]AGN35579.1 putative transporter YhfA [Bacillus paralicheniformis ATCC 9945a]ARA84989.1 hypothetical protein BLMD_05835 [Bacillus paralicheniformis]AYQ15654.1 hypothetical protein D5285_06050 [Bacillus paralicheniformis]